MVCTSIALFLDLEDYHHDSCFLHIKPFTHGFPRADIHELLSPDLLHQIIKGTFKDHLVTWVSDYISAVNTPRQAKKILDDIDRR